MATTPRDDGLPVPSTCDVQSAQERRRSTLGNMRFGGTPDAALSPRVFVFRYDARPWPVIDAVRRHYADHPHGTFQVSIPRTAERVHVRHRSKPVIQWGPATASAAVELEEALAHE